MGYAELIDLVEKLPPERQAEVLDFAEFLVASCRAASEGTVSAKTASQSLADLLAHPLKVKDGFTVMKRDELYDRACLR